MSAIEEKLEVVKKRIAAAKARSPYRQDVTLVAVTKFHPLEDMEEVLRLGVKEVGENRVQELEDKRSRLKMPVVWNLQGHLQKNKVKKAVAAADLIQSVDSVEIMEEIDKRAGQAGKVQEKMSIDKPHRSPPHLRHCFLTPAPHKRNPPSPMH